MLGWFNAEAASASRRKAFEQVWMVAGLGGHKFQCDEPVEAGVLNSVNDTRAAANPPENTIMGNSSADDRIVIAHEPVTLARSTKLVRLSLIVQYRLE